MFPKKFPDSDSLVFPEKNLPRVERGVVYFFTGKALAPRRRVKHVSGLPFACCSTYAFYS